VSNQNYDRTQISKIGRLPFGPAPSESESEHMKRFGKVNNDNDTDTYCNDEMEQRGGARVWGEFDGRQAHSFGIQSVLQCGVVASVVYCYIHTLLPMSSTLYQSNSMSASGSSSSLNAATSAS
jgi:hypothetical protein